MSTVLSGLAMLAAATGALATTIIWVVLTEPVTIAAAVEQGSLRPLVRAVARVWQ